MKDKLRELAERLDVLAHAVTEANWSEFSMRVPVEPNRDADLVMASAAIELRTYAAILDAEGDGGAVTSGVNPDELYAQLTPFADPACRDCDGRGVFYGNVCVCECVMTKLQATHPARSGVVSVTPLLVDTLCNAAFGHDDYGYEAQDRMRAALEAYERNRK